MCVYGYIHWAPHTYTGAPRYITYIGIRTLGAAPEVGVTGGVRPLRTTISSIDICCMPAGEWVGSSVLLWGRVRSVYSCSAG